MECQREIAARQGRGFGPGLGEGNQPPFGVLVRSALATLVLGAPGVTVGKTVGWAVGNWVDTDTQAARETITIPVKRGISRFKDRLIS